MRCHFNNSITPSQHPQYSSQSYKTTEQLQQPYHISNRQSVATEKSCLERFSFNIHFFFSFLRLFLSPSSFSEQPNRKIVHKIPIPFYPRANTPTHSLIHSFINSSSQSPNFHPYPQRIVDQPTLLNRYPTLFHRHPRHTCQDVTLERTRKKMTKKENSYMNPE